jgi:hypothetical protein
MIPHGYCATIHWFRPEAAEVFESSAPRHRYQATVRGPPWAVHIAPRLNRLCHGLRAQAI